MEIDSINDRLMETEAKLKILTYDLERMRNQPLQEG
jgi:hypothetical protein